MSSRIFGVGIGVFLIILLWVVVIFAAFMFSKLKRPTSLIGVLCIVFATILTTILLCIPREHKMLDSKPEKQVQDTMFIWRTAVLVLMGLSFLISLLLMTTEHWIVPVVAKPLKKISYWAASK